MFNWNPLYNWTRQEYINVVRNALTVKGKKTILLDVEHSDRKNMDDLMRWAKEDGFIAKELDMDTIRVSINESPKNSTEDKPNIHGHWICTYTDATFSNFKCSECGREIKCANDYFMKPSAHVHKYFAYCPCGAKMVEVEE